MTRIEEGLAAARLAYDEGNGWPALEFAIRTIVAHEERIENLEEVLKEALHELIAIHGLFSSDDPDLIDDAPEGVWRVNVTGPVERINAVLYSRGEAGQARKEDSAKEEEILEDVLDVVTGWTRPMFAAERLATIHAIAGARLKEIREARPKPKVICLCGSTRFKAQYEAENLLLTLAGNVVLTVAAFGHADNIQFDEHAKSVLDGVHLSKIDLADEVRVINVGGYIGDSTRAEIAYAEAAGKPVTYLDGHTGEAPEEEGG